MNEIFSLEDDDEKVEEMNSENEMQMWRRVDERDMGRERYKKKKVNKRRQIGKFKHECGIDSRNELDKENGNQEWMTKTWGD